MALYTCFRPSYLHKVNYSKSLSECDWVALSEDGSSVVVVRADQLEAYRNTYGSDRLMGRIAPSSSGPSAFGIHITFELLR